MSQNFKKLRVMGVVALALVGPACGGPAEEADTEEVPTSEGIETGAEIATTPQAEIAAAEKEGWKQVWADEFNGTELKKENWGHENDIHVNGEKEQYVDKGVSVGGGSLKITVRHNGPSAAYPYTSGRILSKGKHEWSHGRVEARIKMPVGEGLWPAFWMLGGNIDSAPWPNCGEIDIMENIGYGNWTQGTLHGPNYGDNSPFYDQAHPDGGTDKWHVYRADYSGSGVQWFVDGKEYAHFSKDQVNNVGPYVFDHNFYILFNLAIGGSWPAVVNHAPDGIPESTAKKVASHPQSMEVDWVRVYEKK